MESDDWVQNIPYAANKKGDYSQGYVLWSGTMTEFCVPTRTVTQGPVSFEMFR